MGELPLPSVLCECLVGGPRALLPSQAPPGHLALRAGLESEAARKLGGGLLLGMWPLTGVEWSLSFFFI